MVCELEKEGFPTVHVANMTPVSESLGCNRILKSYGIPYPFCDPSKEEAIQEKQRYEMVCKALDALCTDAKDQTVFQ